MNGSTKSTDSRTRAQRIAESIVGVCEWRGAEAFISCPGIHNHTTPNAHTDCKVVCERIASIPPGIYCFHKSCANELRAPNRALRSALSMGNRSAFPAIHSRPSENSRRVLGYDAEALRKFAKTCEGFGEECFSARSILQLERCTPASFLAELYFPGEKVLVLTEFKSQGQRVWEHKGIHSDMRALDTFRRGFAEGVWFLINPTDARFRLNGKGGRSRRSEANITAWRYWLLESDTAPAELWLAALSRLPLPIAAVYSSGGKSIHALVRVDASSKTDLDAATRQYKRVLVTLGADAAAMSAVRLSRLPQCERGGRLQKLLYLNPSPKAVPICELPEVWSVAK